MRNPLFSNGHFPFAESLESRQLLAVFVAVGPNLVVSTRNGIDTVAFDNRRLRLAANPGIAANDVFLGQLTLTRATDPAERQDRVRNVQLNITSVDDNGLLIGALAIEGLGVFEVTGVVQPGRRVTIVFNEGLGGTIEGRLRRGDQVLAGRLFANDGGDVFRGRLRLFSETTPEFTRFGNRFGFFDDGLIFTNGFTDDNFFFSSRVFDGAFADGSPFFNERFSFFNGRFDFESGRIQNDSDLTSDLFGGSPDLFGRTGLGFDNDLFTTRLGPATGLGATQASFLTGSLGGGFNVATGGPASLF